MGVQFECVRVFICVKALTAGGFTMATIVSIEGWGFLGLLGAIVAYRLLTRQINMSGLLLRKNGSGSPSPERVQLLLATLVVSGKYLSEVFQSSNTGKLPDIDPQWLYALGGSSAVYVLGKALTTFRKRPGKI
jgi:hypothetical protein